jgi:hypothetical protein
MKLPDGTVVWHVRAIDITNEIYRIIIEDGKLEGQTWRVNNGWTYARQYRDPQESSWRWMLGVDSDILLKGDK